MLDLLGIVFSSVIMFLVILRAIQMDSTQPWFRPPKTGVDSSGLRLTPNSPNGNGPNGNGPNGNGPNGNGRGRQNKRRTTS
jgi:hypothetical protein